MGFSYNLGSRPVKWVGYSLSLYLCYIAGVTIPEKVLDEIRYKVTYIASHLASNIVGRPTFIDHKRNQKDSLGIITDLIAEQCKLKGRCLEGSIEDYLQGEP